MKFLSNEKQSKFPWSTLFGWLTLTPYQTLRDSISDNLFVHLSLVLIKDKTADQAEMVLQELKAKFPQQLNARLIGSVKLSTLIFSFRMLFTMCEVSEESCRKEAITKLIPYMNEQDLKTVFPDDEYDFRYQISSPSWLDFMIQRRKLSSSYLHRIDRSTISEISIETLVHLLAQVKLSKTFEFICLERICNQFSFVLAQDLIKNDLSNLQGENQDLNELLIQSPSKNVRRCFAEYGCRSLGYKKSLPESTLDDFNQSEIPVGACYVSCSGNHHFHFRNYHLQKMQKCHLCQRRIESKIYQNL